MTDRVWCEVHQREHPPGWPACAPRDRRPAPPAAGLGPFVPPSEVEGLDLKTMVLVDEARAAARVIADMDGLLGVVRRLALWADDSVRATRCDSAGGQPCLWCSRHEQDVRRCDPDGLCRGEPYRPGLDPTGELATDHSGARRAAEVEQLRVVLDRLRDLSKIRRHLERVAAEVRPRMGVASPVGAEVEWCPSCLRVGECAPPAMLPDGGRRYRGGLCRWCGPITASYGMWPAVDAVRAHLEGRRLHQAQLDQLMRSAGWAGSRSRAKRR